MLLRGRRKSDDADLEEGPVVKGEPKSRNPISHI